MSSYASVYFLQGSFHLGVAQLCARIKEISPTSGSTPAPPPPSPEEKSGKTPEEKSGKVFPLALVLSGAAITGVLLLGVIFFINFQKSCFLT